LPSLSFTSHSATLQGNAAHMESVTTPPYSLKRAGSNRQIAFALLRHSRQNSTWRDVTAPCQTAPYTARTKRLLIASPDARVTDAGSDYQSPSLGNASRLLTRQRCAVLNKAIPNAARLGIKSEFRQLLPALTMHEGEKQSSDCLDIAVPRVT
jgi:hypothetical protein